MMELHVFPQQVEIDPAVSVGVQDELPRIATLGYVVRNIYGNYTSQSSHGQPK